MVDKETLKWLGTQKSASQSVHQGVGKPPEKGGSTVREGCRETLQEYDQMVVSEKGAPKTKGTMMKQQESNKA